MDLMDFVLEARKSPTRLNIKAETPEDDAEEGGDPSANVPEDPEEETEPVAEDNADDEDDDADDPSQNVPTDDAEEEEPAEDDNADDPSANVPTDDEGDQGGEEDPQPGTSVNMGANANDDADDPSANVPTDDEGAGTPPADEPQPAADTTPQPTGGEQPGGAGGALNINANQADDAATANTDDFSAGVPDPDAGGDDQGGNPPADQGAGNDPNAGAQGADNPAGANPTAGDQGAQDNDPNAQGADGQQDPNNPDANAEGEEGGDDELAGDDGSDIDNMDSSNSFSNASDNGEDTKNITETDKKNNIIILRNAYVKLYSEVNAFIGKMQNTRKDSILSVATYAQVKDNMEKLRSFLMDYICIYYDTNEYEINLFNFEYIMQHIRVNIKMLAKMKEGKTKLGLLNSISELKKKK
jgi:hypothetical protein